MRAISSECCVIRCTPLAVLILVLPTPDAIGPRLNHLPAQSRQAEIWSLACPSALAGKGQYCSAPSLRGGPARSPPPRRGRVRVGVHTGRCLDFDRLPPSRPSLARGEGAHAPYASRVPNSIEGRYGRGRASVGSTHRSMTYPCEPAERGHTRRPPGPTYRRETLVNFQITRTLI
jgi:hypothetical protein